ncbi:SpoIIE family protein phosphatase [Thermopolyspora sp. NPDC052614]|uniref:SpoIIE family protein phosphatase n=1 Tax=Thermopolyspora sp. NPDC052614 TaxID=3155682 RepID=UPI0034426B43
MTSSQGEGKTPEWAFEAFLRGEPVEHSVRPAILRAWQRWRTEGVAWDKLGFGEPVEIDPDSFLIRMARPVFESARHIIADADAALLLVNEESILQLRYLSDPQMESLFDRVNAVIGVSYSESVLGPTGTGTALHERRPFRVSAFEHLTPAVQPLTATGVPIFDPLTGHIRGAVGIVCYNEHEDLAMAVLAHKVAMGVERRMLEAAGARERTLFEAFLRAGDLPGRLAPGGAGTGLRDLPRADRLLLEEKAAELIADGRRAAIEVPLSRERVAVLRSVPMTDPAAAVGVLAQVRIQGGPWEPLAAPAEPVPPELVRGTPLLTLAQVRARAVNGGRAAPPPQQPPRESPRGPLPEAPAAAGDPWLLLFGEPGVGKIAAAARKRMRVLYEAATNMGKTLDVVRTAEELAEVTAARFADAVAVDLYEPVLHGEEPGEPVMGEGLRRVAARAVREDLFPAWLGQPVHYPPSCPQLGCLRSQEAVVWTDPRAVAPAVDRGVGMTIGDPRARSIIAVPLVCHETVLGVATFMRTRESEPFDEDDVALAEELAGRAAVCVDNARRFTRERVMATALRRSMLPRRLPEQNAVEVAHRYVPAWEGAGGAWFDVICLSGTRVALVVGDVAGRGLHGVATMGRLRTAIGNFAALDMPPAEILAQLNDLARRLEREEADEEGRVLQDVPGAAEGAGVTGTTCVYAVYDPISRRCTLAGAGHPAPVLVRPDGRAEFLDLPRGQPLGLGGPPFESIDVEIPEGGELVLYTRGLLVGSPDVAAERLLRALDHASDRALDRAGGTAAQTCASALAAVPPGRLTDDVAVLVGRTRALDPDHVARWDVSADPAVVARVRGEFARRLAAWNLEELAFTTELILSELLTNAIRYGAQPIQVRLILDRTLICEVSDASETSPRPRRAAATDEGGRGLFLVAQLAERWGTRYTRRGKVIWAEQPLTGPGDALDGPSPLLALAADEL